MTKKKLAIISTYDELCGIASYTRYLEKYLGKSVEITVFDLDQFLLRSTHKAVIKMGDDHIREICARLREFDCVNIQLEYGTLGKKHINIVQRFKMLVDSSNKLIVTFHTMPNLQLTLSKIFIDLLKDRKILKCITLLFNWKREQFLNNGVVGYLKKNQNVKPISAIVHTRRDARFLKYIAGIKNVYDHPLAFIKDAKSSNVKDAVNAFPTLKRLPKETKLIGVYGFVGKYKGFDTVIHALTRLPENYHVLIFGGVHPNEIQLNEPIYPFIQTLIEETNADKSQVETVVASLSKSKNIKNNISIQLNELNSVGAQNSKDISHRVHFMGAPNDAKFEIALQASDIVVMPYLEVGQSASGPISMANELNKPIVASRTHAFMQYAKYHPERLTFFDIGNYIELAERILDASSEIVRYEIPKFNTHTNSEIYLSAIQYSK